MSLPNVEIVSMLGRENSPVEPKNGIGTFYKDLDPVGGGSGFSLKHGRVIDIWTKQGVVLVQCAGCNIVKCGLNILSSGLLTGSTEVAIPTIGDLVLVAKKEGAESGLIICAFPSWSASSMASVKTVNSLEKKSIELTDAKTFEMEDFIFPGNQFGPKFADMLPGEKYNLNENLIGTILTKYFMRIQAGDLCSLTFQYLDGMLEAMLHNLRIFNSGFFLESICDYGRTNTELHLSAHLNDFAVASEEDRRKNSIIRLFSGWLSAGAHIYSQNGYGEKEPGSDIWLDELGTVAIRSNSCAFMQKVDGIYVPLRKFRADHPNKDEADREIDSRIARRPFVINGDSSGSPMGFGCKVRDYIAYLMGGEYQFCRYDPYKKDWEKIEKPQRRGSLPTINGFNGTYGDQYSITPSIEIGNSERDGDTNTARVGEAFCGALPDGSVLLRDAWGSQVELRGGRVIISGANDIEVTSGSNVVITAGKDAIVKAAKDCEIIAMNSDIRIRSGKMLMIESAEGGIQITAPKNSGVQVDKQGNEYSSSGIVLKSDEVEVIGKKFEANLKESFIVQGQTHDAPPAFLVRSRTNLFWDKSGTYFKNGEGDKYVGVSGGSVFATDGMYAEGWGIFYEGIATNGLVAAIDGGIYTNGSFIGSPPYGPPEPPMEPLDPLNFVEQIEPAFEQSDWDILWRLPFKKEDYDEIKFKHRTTEQYRTQSAKWFEKFWQRQYKASLSVIEYAKDADLDGENSYPGKKHIDGSKKDLILYTEVNVEEDGSPKPPEEQNPEGGTFTSVPYSKQLFKL